MTPTMYATSHSSRASSSLLRWHATSTVTYAWTHSGPWCATYTTLTKRMQTWLSRLPQLLALEDWMDRPFAWSVRQKLAEDNGQHVQPLFTFKDVWDLCICEGGNHYAVTQEGVTEDDDLVEYLRCPLGKGSWSTLCRYDWRPGRELTEEQATRWALHHDATHAHHLFPGPAKENASAPLSASDVRDGFNLNLRDFIGALPDVELTDWQRERLETALRPGRFHARGARFYSSAVGGGPDDATWRELTGVTGIELREEPIELTYERVDYGPGQLIARRGSICVRMDVSEELVEDAVAYRIARDRLIHELNRLYERSRRQSSRTHREGPTGP